MREKVVVRPLRVVSDGEPSVKILFKNKLEETLGVPCIQGLYMS